MFNIIARRTLLAYLEKFPEAAVSLQEWYREMLIADYKNFNELKTVYPNASPVGDQRVVFNIKGNKYRLVVRIIFDYKTIQIKWFCTHKEYDDMNVKTVQYKKKE